VIVVKLSHYKLIFCAVGLIGTLLIATPALALFLHPSGEESYTELYLLGPENLTTNYPQIVTLDQNYSLNVGLINHLGSLGYYVLYVKLRNLTDPLPDIQKGIPSPLSAIYEYRLTLADGQNWQTTVNFKFANVTITPDLSLLQKLVINNLNIDVNKVAAWNSTSNLSSFHLFFELWLYNGQSGSFQFNDRYVGLKMNYTQPSISRT
jgi:hypothetical protein